MFIYEYLIVFTNLFGAYGKSKLNLVKIMFYFLEDYLIEKFIQKDLKEDQKLYILHRLENELQYSVITFIDEYRSRALKSRGS